MLHVAGGESQIKLKASGGDHDPSSCGKEECQCIFKSGSEVERNARSGGGNKDELKISLFGNMDKEGQSAYFACFLQTMFTSSS